MFFDTTMTSESETLFLSGVDFNDAGLGGNKNYKQQQKDSFSRYEQLSEQPPPLNNLLMIQPWQPIECKMNYEFNIRKKENIKEIFQIKLLFRENYYALLLTDFINVWYCYEDYNKIQTMHSIFNPAIKFNSMSQINKHLSNMLLSGDDQSGSHHATQITFVDPTYTHLKLKCSMRIEDVVTFQWEFVFKKYGNSFDQANVLKHQLILPLMTITNELASHLNPQILTNLQLKKGEIFQKKTIEDTLHLNLRLRIPELYKTTMDCYLTQDSNDNNNNNDNNYNNYKPTNVVIPKPKGPGPPKKKPFEPVNNNDNNNIANFLNVNDDGHGGSPNKKRRIGLVNNNNNNTNIANNDTNINKNTNRKNKKNNVNVERINNNNNNNNDDDTFFDEQKDIILNENNNNNDDYQDQLNERENAHVSNVVISSNAPPPPPNENQNEANEFSKRQELINKLNAKKQKKKKQPDKLRI